MRVKLTGGFGPALGLETEIDAGRTVRIGRNPGEAGLPVPGDEQLSDVHFSIECTPADCRLRNHAPTGTTVSGSRATEPVALADGDLIAAGQSQFTVKYESATLQQLLRRQALPLYAVLDAAREQRVPQLLEQSGAQYQSLYEGQRGDALGAVAPYLAALSPSPRLTEGLIAHAWGKSWTLFLASRLGFEELRKHFRHFLMVEAENGQRMLFRFYDPRVIRVYLPSSKPAECAEFFGGIDRFLVESDEGKAVLRFRLSPDGLVQEQVHLESDSVGA